MLLLNHAIVMYMLEQEVVVLISILSISPRRSMSSPSRSFRANRKKLKRSLLRLSKVYCKRKLFVRTIELIQIRHCLFTFVRRVRSFTKYPDDLKDSFFFRQRERDPAAENRVRGRAGGVSHGNRYDRLDVHVAVAECQDRFAPTPH